MPRKKTNSKETNMPRKNKKAIERFHEKWDDEQPDADMIHKPIHPFFVKFSTAIETSVDDALAVMKEVSDDYHAAYGKDYSYFDVYFWDEAHDQIDECRWIERERGQWKPTDTESNIELEIEGKYYAGYIGPTEWKRRMEILRKAVQNGLLSK